MSPAKPHLTKPVPLSTTSGFSVIPDAVYALTKHEGKAAKDVCRPRTWLARTKTQKFERKLQKKTPKKSPTLFRTFLFWKKKWAVSLKESGV